MLANFIIIAIVTAIVFGIRYTLWKDEVPENIAKNRWLIAIVCAVIFLVIGVAIQSANNQPTQAGGHVIYAILGWTVANALKNKDNSKSK